MTHPEPGEVNVVRLPVGQVLAMLHIMVRGHAVSPEAARRLTLDEWAALPEDDEGELVDGLVVEEEMPDFVHETAVARLFAWFWSWLPGRGGRVVGSELKLGVGARRGRKADLVVYFAGRRPPGRGVVRLPPDILVEVVTPRPRDARRDRLDKTDDYAAFGVRYYWILDPELRSLEIFELGRDGRYARAMGLTDGNVTGIPGCDGAPALDLDALWRDIDVVLADPTP